MAVLAAPINGIPSTPLYTTTTFYSYAQPGQAKALFYILVKQHEPANDRGIGLTTLPQVA